MKVSNLNVVTLYREATQRMNVACSSEMCVHIKQITWRNIQKTSAFIVTAT